MHLVRTVLTTAAGTTLALAMWLGSAPGAAGQDACVHASAGLVTTTVHEGDCPTIPPESNLFPCPGGVGVYADGDIPTTYEVLVCVF